MSRMIRLEIPDEYADELKNRALADGVDEQEEARRLFILGCQVSKAMAEWEARQAADRTRKSERPGLAGILDRLDDYIESDEFKRKYLEYIKKH